MKAKEEVSATDIHHLQLIRESVAAFIQECSNEYNKENSIVLDVAPQDWEGLSKIFNKSTVKTLDIDPSSKATYIADLTKNNEEIIPSSFFDFVLCTEVLEHTLNPFEATKEIHRILKPGAVLALTVPLNFRIHGPLPDCWRFTKYGIQALLKDFTILKLDEVESDRFLFPIQYKVLARKNEPA